MKVDINYQFITLDGEPIKDREVIKDKDGNPKRDKDGFPLMKDGAVITLRTVCERALLTPIEGIDPRSGRPIQKQLTVEEKLKYWDLAQAIHKSDGMIELSAEEITLLKELIHKKYPSQSLTYNQAAETLDPNTKQ